MPQLGTYKWISDVVFFLYPTLEDAKRGTSYGGTGFFIGVPSVKFGHQHYHIHAVTNWHVACQAGCSNIRVNLRDGGTEIFEFGPEEWTFKPGWHDLAISPPIAFDSRVHKVEAIAVASLVADHDINYFDIGPAEDVFMIGRFIDYDGIETNEPSYRFGNISILNAKLCQQTGFTGSSLVIDMHSRTGYSGSPVWIFRTPGSVFKSGDLSMAWHFVRLLGIHWGQFPERWEIKNPSDHRPTLEASTIRDGQYVDGLSGMTCCIPAEFIITLLADERLTAMRLSADDEIVPDMQRYVQPQYTNSAYASPYGSDIKRQIERHLGIPPPGVVGPNIIF